MDTRAEGTGATASQRSGMDVLIRTADDRILGRGRSEDLPVVAADALARGIDSPTLRELAGLGRADVREAADLFEQAMTELGHPPRAVDEVVWARIRQAARSLRDGRMAPEYAAEEVADLLLTLGPDNTTVDPRASHLLHLSDWWLDNPADRQSTSDEIRSTVSEISGLS